METETSDFSRYDEFEQKLSKIRTHFQGSVMHNNGAVIVRNRNGRQSIGVTRLLNNYYRPSEEELTRINKSEDQGREISFAAWKHSVDKETCAAKFRTLVDEQRFEYYDSGMTVDDALLEHAGLVPIGKPEFALGSPSLVAREQPSSSATLKHLVGSIDRHRYNKRRAKLVFVELKSGNTKAPYMTMRALYLKEKHAKQLTLYAFIFQIMAMEAGVKITADDIELIIIGYDTVKRAVSVWEMQYDPKTFLGSYWATEHWHGLIDMNCLMRLTLDSLCCVPGCRKKALYQSQSRPDLRYCSDKCREWPHCDCGKPAECRSNSTGKYLCKSCSELY